MLQEQTLHDKQNKKSYFLPINKKMPIFEALKKH